MSEPTKDPTAAGSPGAAGSAIQWLDWHSGRPHANPTASSLVAGHYCTGNPEAGWVLYSRGGSCWHARTQPERPPLPGMVPARTPEGWVWQSPNAEKSATGANPHSQSA